MPEEYTTYFKSVIAFGKIRLLEDPAEKREAIEKLAIKYYPANNQTNRDRSIDKEWNPLCTFVLSVEYMTGKAAIEIVPEGM